MSNKIQFNIGYTVNKEGLNELKNSLLSIKSLTTSDVMNLNKSLNLQEARTQLRQVKNSAEELSKILNNSFNKDLGTFNISKFNNELRALGIDRIQQIQKDLYSVGAEGQISFKNIATQVMTTNQQLKSSHKILNSMAYTMKNTLKWALSSSVMNEFSGSIQQAYGYIKSLDRSLNDIRIVTNKSSEDMANFAVQANKAASELKTSTTDYTQASLIYAQCDTFLV